jgi:hypothetical protein
MAATVFSHYSSISQIIKEFKIEGLMTYIWINFYLTVGLFYVLIMHNID